MSVKLIVVALLATAVAADATVKTTMCADGAQKADTCACTSPATQEYATTCPEKADENGVFWKADSCDANTDAFMVKGYSKAGCAAGEMKVKKACTAVSSSYMKGECKDNTVKLYSDCSTDKCDTGADSCTKPFSFAANACTEFTDGYFKVKGGACPTNGQNIVLQKFMGSECTTSAGEEYDATYLATCTAAGVTQYQKSTCTPGDNGKVTISTCTDEDCTGLLCVDKDVPFKQYTEVDDQILYIESCKADDTEFTFQVYAGVQKYTNTCTAVTGGYAMAACTEKSPKKDSGSNSSGSGSDSDSNNTTNETTSTGVIAPAHTVGVLALALCLLACLY